MAECEDAMLKKTMDGSFCFRWSSGPLALRALGYPGALVISQLRRRRVSSGAPKESKILKDWFLRNADFRIQIL